MAGDFELVDLRTEVADAAQRKALCEAFYTDVYRDAFPKADQVETPKVWLPLLNADLPPPAPILHLIVARHRSGGETDGAVVAGLVIEYFRRSRVALVTYIAVAPDFRRQGLGGQMLAKAVQKVSKDNGGVRPLIVAEVERPDAQNSEAARKAAHGRLAIMAALGGKRLDFSYIQPKLSLDQNAVTDLMLVALGSAGAAASGVPASTVRAFLEEFFSSLNQRDSEDLEFAIDSLPAGSVPLKDLRAYE